jgi:hypothetical protein
MILIKTNHPCLRVRHHISGSGQEQYVSRSMVHGQFRRFLNKAHLKELHLRGHLFTWRNECASPTLECIDRAFVTNGWDQLYPSCDLHFLTSQCSDHAPLLLRMDPTVSRRFTPSRPLAPDSRTSFLETGTTRSWTLIRSGAWTGSYETLLTACRVGAHGSWAVCIFS